MGDSTPPVLGTKKDHPSGWSLCKRLPIVPGRFQPSIVGTSELNCRVRDGNGCTLTVINTYSLRCEPSELNKETQERWHQVVITHPLHPRNVLKHIRLCRSSPRSISTAKLKTSPSLHTQPIYHVVFVGSYLITQWDILS